MIKRRTQVFARAYSAVMTPRIGDSGGSGKQQIPY
jgi:hypothetical protein